MAEAPRQEIVDNSPRCPRIASFKSSLPRLHPEAHRLAHSILPGPFRRDVIVSRTFKPCRLRVTWDVAP